jgi:ABC-type bacteriocin/lantibiotic exporter with double-glycine peptidase domain
MDERQPPDCGTAAAALVAELLKVDFTDEDLALVRPSGSAVTFASLTEWFTARGLAAVGVEANAESLSTLQGVCILQVVADSLDVGNPEMHFLVAIPRGASTPPTILDATLPLGDQASLDPTSTLQRWTGRTLVVSRVPDVSVVSSHAGGWAALAVAVSGGMVIGYALTRGRAPRGTEP